MSVRATGGATAGAASADERGGFALAVVVFLLFAVGLAAATGYRVIQTESELSVYSGDAAKALVIADAGIERLIGRDAPGLDLVHTDSISGGVAVVSSRRVFVPAFPHEVRLVTSRGSFADPQLPDLPAVRTVRRFVHHRRAPLDVLAAVATTGTVQINQSGPVPERFDVDPSDQGTCSDAPVSVPATYETATLEELAVAWDVLTDPALGPDFEELPGTATTDYPLTRIDGDLLVTSTDGGRGLLVVTGSLTITGHFAWHGIILVGGGVYIDVPTSIPSGFGIFGVLVAGLDGSAPLVDLETGRLRFNSCEVIAAGARFARVTSIPNTWHEVY